MDITDSKVNNGAFEAKHRIIVPKPLTTNRRTRSHNVASPFKQNLNQTLPTMKSNQKDMFAEDLFHSRFSVKDTLGTQEHKFGRNRLSFTSHMTKRVDAKNLSSDDRMKIDVKPDTKWFESERLTTSCRVQNSNTGVTSLSYTQDNLSRR